MGLYELPRRVTHPWITPSQVHLTWEFFTNIQPKRYPPSVVFLLTYPRCILLFSGLLGYYIIGLDLGLDLGFYNLGLFVLWFFNLGLRF